MPLCVVALLFLYSLPSAPPVRAACPEPAEFESEAGLTTHVICHGGGRGPLRGPARLLYDLRLDLNRASARSLQALPGIGPILAQEIVAARPFARLEELQAVRGIGPRRFSRIAPYLELSQQGLPGPGTGSLPRGRAGAPEVGG